MAKRFTETFSSNGIAIDTINSTSNGLLANSTQMSFGNSTVNAIITCGTFTLGGGIATNNSGMYISSSFLGFGNTTVNTSVNSTIFTGTANNANNIGGVPAANVVTNTQLSSNLANYPNTATFAVANVAANGSFNLPGGWHIAFGQATTNSTGGVAVTFANAFTSNAYSVSLTPVAGGTFNTTIPDAVHANAVTKTGFTIYCGNSTAGAAANVYFMAIGF